MDFQKSFRNVPGLFFEPFPKTMTVHDYFLHANSAVLFFLSALVLLLKVFLRMTWVSATQFHWKRAVWAHSSSFAFNLLLPV